MRLIGVLILPSGYYNIDAEDLQGDFHFAARNE